MTIMVTAWRVVIGLLVTLVVSALIPSGTGATAFGLGGTQLLFASIVCTAGMSLLLWIPLWWVIGTVILYSGGYPARRQKPERVDGPPGMDAALRAYLGRARRRGFAPEDVSLRLRREGWSDDEIAGALADVFG